MARPVANNNSSPVIFQQTALNKEQEIHGWFQGEIVDRQGKVTWVHGTAKAERVSQEGIVHITLPLTVNGCIHQITFEITPTPRDMFPTILRDDIYGSPRQPSLLIVYPPGGLLSPGCQWHAYLCHLDQTVRITERNMKAPPSGRDEDKSEGWRTLLCSRDKTAKDEVVQEIAKETFLQYAVPHYLYDELETGARRHLDERWNDTFAIMGDRQLSPPKKPSAPKLMSAGLKQRDQEIDDALRGCGMEF